MATPDEHLAVLRETLEMYDRFAAMYENSNSAVLARSATLQARRAAAIRWLLAETAHGVDPREIVV